MKSPARHKMFLALGRATDPDHDGRKELWIDYRLMYGEIGRMVWEQSDSGEHWAEIANECFACD